MAREEANSRSSKIKLTVPPVVQVIAAAISMWLVTQLAPLLDFTFVGQHLVSGALVACGLIVAIVAVGDFRKAKTTVNPKTPSEADKLIIKGPYRISRNPMYLGFLMILCGWALGLGNIASLGIPAIFVWYMTMFQIKPEEEALQKKFGADYDAYCKKTRRWV